MLNDHDYFAQAQIDRRRRELEQQLTVARWRRETREQDERAIGAGVHRRPGWLRVALGTLLVKLGSALIGCEAHARAALERRVDTPSVSHR